MKDYNEILAMPAGREMDAAVAEKFFGWTDVKFDRIAGIIPLVLSGDIPGGIERDGVQRYSTDPAAAMMVWQEIAERVYVRGGWYSEMSLDRCMSVLWAHETSNLKGSDKKRFHRYEWFFKYPDLMPLTVCWLALMLAEKDGPHDT